MRISSFRFKRALVLDTSLPANLSRHQCLWWDSIGDLLALADLPEPSPRFTGEARCDVSIVGGGLSGLWSAIWLKTLIPDLSVVLVEQYQCGFGASGRNGGWLMGSIEGMSSWADSSGVLSADLRETITTIIPEVKTQLDRFGIDCDLSHGGGVLAAARYPQQASRAQGFLRDLERLGFTPADYHWLDATAARAMVNVRGCAGAIYTPHIATIHPLKLVLGLKRAALSLGVTIYENSPVCEVNAGTLRTNAGTLQADTVIIATEGYANGLDRKGVTTLPVESGIVATEPLTSSQWAELGFQSRPVFADFSRFSTYLQRTADDRLVVGARGSYQWGAKPSLTFDLSAREQHARIKLATQLFPLLKGVTFTHRWGGSVGVTRAMRPEVVADTQGKLICLGGYIGEGVGGSFLMARTVAEHLAGLATPRTSAPWLKIGPMEHRLTWPPEPLPWLAITALRGLWDLEDQWLRFRYWARSWPH